MMSQVFHIQELHTCNCTFKKKSCSMMSQVFHIQELHTCNCTFKKKKKILFYDVTGISYSRIAS